MNIFENTYGINEYVDNHCYGIIYQENSTLNLIIFESKEDAIDALEILRNTRDIEYLEDFAHIEIINDINPSDIEDTKNGLYYDDIQIINNKYIELYN